MNKKKLPKVIVSWSGETSPFALQGLPATQAASTRDSNAAATTTAAAQLSVQEDNVVPLIRTAGPDEADERRDASTSPIPRLVAATAARRSRALAIVDRYAACSAIGGLIPVPALSFAGITTVIVRMVKSLCAHYGMPFKQDRARALVIGLVGGAMPTGAAVIASSTLFYLAPPAALIGLTASCLTAAAFTRSAGRIFVEHFESGASLDALSSAAP